MKKITCFLTLLIFLGPTFIYAQDIHFSFANAQTTNDGVDDYYEVDVFIQTINSTGSFKLGSGQLYFNYNNAAFGTNVFSNGSFDVTYPDAEGYLCGQPIDLVDVIAIYGPFTTNDNTTSRVSWAFSQTYSSSTFAADNVSEVPVKLCHLKIKYADVNEAAQLTFESGSSFDNQFYTACGPAAGGPTELADCNGEAGMQLVNDTFDSSGSNLSDKVFELLIDISVYPNPSNSFLFIKGNTRELIDIEILSVTGQKVLRFDENLNRINIESLQSGVYFVKVNSKEASKTIKLIKN